MPTSVFGSSWPADVVKGEHGVGFAAAEVGLQLDHRVAARLTRQAPERALKEPGQAVGHVGATEELDGVAILAGGITALDLGEVGGKLGLGVAAARDVGMRHHHLAPRLEPGRGCALQLQRLASGLLARLLGEHRAQHLLAHVGQLGRLLSGGDGLQQALGAVERAVGVLSMRTSSGGPTGCARRSARRPGSARRGPEVLPNTSRQFCTMVWSSAWTSQCSEPSGVALELALPVVIDPFAPAGAHRASICFSTKGASPWTKVSMARPTRSRLVTAMASTHFRVADLPDSRKIMLGEPSITLASSAWAGPVVGSRAGCRGS